MAPDSASSARFDNINHGQSIQIVICKNAEQRIVQINVLVGRISNRRDTLKRILTLCLPFFLFFGCTSVHNTSVRDTSYRTDCRHRALISAFTFADKGYPVRIAYGQSGSYSHVQAQAYVEDEWKFLRWNGGEVWIGKKDNFSVTHIFTLREFCGRQLMFALEQWEKRGNTTMLDKREWIVKGFQLDKS